MGPRHASDGLGPGAGARRVLAAVAVAVLAVVALFAAWHTLQDDDPSVTASAPVSSSPPATKSPKPASSLSPRASPKSSASAKSSASPRSSRPREPTATPDPTHSARPTAPNPTRPATKPSKPSKKPPANRSERPDRTVDVVVLNATHRTGLAAAAAARLRGLGWHIVGVANWRGAPVTATSLFTTLGPSAARRTLLRDVPQISAVRQPLPSMSHGRFVIVLAADYP